MNDKPYQGQLWQEVEVGGGCPFCGGEYLRTLNYGHLVERLYCCGTRESNYSWSRSTNCYERQIAQLKERLDEVLIKDRGKTNEINILTKENNGLKKCLEAWRSLSVLLAKTIRTYL